MKLLLIIALFSTTLIAAEKFEFSVKKESEGFACSKARGESRRKLNAICEKKEMKVDWDDIKISTCKVKKLESGKYKATYVYKYKCIE